MNKININNKLRLFSAILIALFVAIVFSKNLFVNFGPELNKGGMIAFFDKARTFASIPFDFLKNKFKKTGQENELAKIPRLVSPTPISQPDNSQIPSLIPTRNNTTPILFPTIPPNSGTTRLAEGVIGYSSTTNSNIYFISIDKTANVQSKLYKSDDGEVVEIIEYQ